MERKDTEAVLACYSDYYFAPTPPHTKGDLRRHLQEMLDAGAEVSCSFQILSKSEHGDRALAVARRQLEVRRNGGGHARSDDLKIKFARGIGGWRIVSASRLIPGATAPRAGEPYVVDSHGVQITLPGNWQPFLTAPGPAARSSPPLLELEEPDLTSQISFTVKSLAVPLAPAALADIFQCRMNACVPDCQVVRREVRQGEGESEVRLDFLVPGSELAEFQRAVVLQHGNDLLIFALDALERAEAEEHEGVFSGMIKSVKYVPPAPAPPSRGCLLGRTYVNDVYGCRIELPPGWTARIGSALDFCASAESPDQRAMILVGGLQLPEAASAAKILDGDDAFASQLDSSFELLGKQEIVVDGHAGAESYSVFEIGAPRKKRWRVYVVRDDVLYLVVSDTTPPEAFEEYRETLTAALDSFRFLPPGEGGQTPAPPAPPAP